MWMTSCTGSVRGGFWEIWEKSVELRTRHRTRRVDFRLLAEARPVALWRVPHVLWADGNASIERLCISLSYVETFNSKVIKSFVPELRSRYVFFVFRDSYVLCIYVMNIPCTFHIFMLHVYLGSLCHNSLLQWFSNFFLPPHPSPPDQNARVPLFQRTPEQC